MQLKVKKLHPDAIIPKYATNGAACFDLHALLRIDEIANTHDGVIRTGLSFEVPDGFVMLIYSRSGHGFNYGVRLANCVGVIDSDYRGEVKVKLHQDGLNKMLCVNNGDRIAQAMLVQLPRVELIEADELSDTERGAGGFGSTGES